MHELWLCRQMLKLVEQRFSTLKGAKAVKTITLAAGALTHLDKPSFIFGFEVASKGSCAQGAKLIFIEVPGEAQCEACAFVFPLAHYGESCPNCDSTKLKITQGEDLKLQSMEVN